MASIFITGITGFLGRRLAELLVKGGHKVSGIGTKSTSDFTNYWQCDLREKNRVIEIVKKVDPEIIIHLAALARVTSGQVMEYYETNVLGTENLLTAIEVLGGRRRIIFSSSAAVYGNQEIELLTEDLELLPVSHYGISKFAGERLLANVMPNHNVTIVRPFNIIGYEQPADFLVPKIIRHFADRHPCIRLGNISTLRDYMDLDSLCRIMVLLLDKTNTYNETINLCSGEGISAQNVIHLLTELTEHSIHVDIAPEYIRNNEIWSLVGSTEKLKKLLPEALTFSFRDSLRNILEKTDSVHAHFC